MFTQKLFVRMYDTDAAGILYFGSQFRFAHDAFESMMAQEGLTFQDLFTKEDFIFVIVHAESDYMSSLHVGDPITVSLWISRIGETSFEISYNIHKEDGTLAGKAKTVHVCLDKASHSKRKLPAKIETLLHKYIV